MFCTYNFKGLYKTKFVLYILKTRQVESKIKKKKANAQKENIAKNKSETELLAELKKLREAYVRNAYQSHFSDIIDDNTFYANDNFMQELESHSIDVVKNEAQPIVMQMAHKLL